MNASATVKFPVQAVTVRINLREVGTTDEYWCMVTNETNGASTNVDGLRLSAEEQRTIATDSIQALKSVARTAVRFAHEDIGVWVLDDARCTVRRRYS